MCLFATYVSFIVICSIQRYCELPLEGATQRAISRALTQSTKCFKEQRCIEKFCICIGVKLYKYFIQIFQLKAL